MDYIAFIEKTINSQLPDHLNDPGLLELVKTYQVDVHSRNCWKYDRINVDSPMVDILLTRQLLQNQLIINLAMLKARGFNMEKYITKASQKLY